MPLFYYMPVPWSIMLSFEYNVKSPIIPVSGIIGELVEYISRLFYYWKLWKFWNSWPWLWWLEIRFPRPTNNATCYLIQFLLVHFMFLSHIESSFLMSLFLKILCQLISIP